MNSMRLTSTRMTHRYSISISSILYSIFLLTIVKICKLTVAVEEACLLLWRCRHALRTRHGPLHQIPSIGDLHCRAPTGYAAMLVQWLLLCKGLLRSPRGIDPLNNNNNCDNNINKSSVLFFMPDFKSHHRSFQTGHSWSIHLHWHISPVQSHQWGRWRPQLAGATYAHCHQAKLC